MDFMGREARTARLNQQPVAAAPQVAAQTVAPSAKAEGGMDMSSIAAAVAKSLGSGATTDAAQPDATNEVAATATNPSDMSIEATTAAILANLTQAVTDDQSANAEATAEDKAMMEMTVAALQGLRGVQGEEFGQGDISEPTEVIEGGTTGLLSQTEDVTYTVQVGDSLGSLALRFYGDATMFPAIYEANRKVLATPESIRFGMKLLIPAQSGL
jgi:nucleoid-associated protein YgaU